MTVGEIIKLYSSKLDYIDLELLLMDSLSKTREFILTYPEHELDELQIKNFKLKIARRMHSEPIAHIVGHKEFYGLDFIVNKHTLVPRPETEMMIDLVINEISNFLLQAYPNECQYPISNLNIIDIGTGSGNIITSIANTVEHGAWSMEQKKQIHFHAVDISKEALKIAKKMPKIIILMRKLNSFMEIYYSQLLEI